MWLDGLYMGEPFFAEYSFALHEEANFEDIAKQFILIESHLRDETSGLLYQAWDQSKMERWPDKKTGVSKSLWARSDGRFAMALVDVLDKGNLKGNYLESSASSMFVYALAKGVRLGYLPNGFLALANKGYKGIIKNFIETKKR